jgi:hypothetical protein
MTIKKKLFAVQDGIVLLENGEPKEIGGIADSVKFELIAGITIDAICVFFNLVKEIDSTDFFLFTKEDEKLISYSIGERTDPFFVKMYEDVLSNRENHDLTEFLPVFIGLYIVKGLMSDNPLF